MDTLLPIARRIAERLIARRETIAVAEGSSGGLIAAALLAIPGASAYFRGGAVVYTAAARAGLLGISSAEMAGMRAATEPFAAMLAGCMRERLGATWGLAEAGAAGPAGNRYGDPAGHSCFAVAGNTHAADRQRRSRVQHARVLSACACAPGRGDRRLTGSRFV
jgi:nicotinamide-nucleotide amidase